MCTMDYFGSALHLSLGQNRLLLWGTNVLIFLFWLCTNIFQRKGFVPFREKGISIVLYLFLFWICLSIFFSQDPVIGVKRTGHLVIALVNAYIFYDFFSRSKENVQFFVRVITFLVAFVSVWAILESFQKLSLGQTLFKNIQAGFCNPNFLGHFFFLFSPLMFSFYLIYSPFRGRYWPARLLFLIIMGYALILSYSRSSWNGFLFAVIFLIFWKSKSLGFGLLLLAIMANASLYLISNGQFHRTTWEKVYADRILWKDYSQIALENPIFGLGWGVVPSEKTSHAHNLYLSNATQLGLVSVFLVIAFYMLLFSRSYQIAKKLRDPQLRAILLGSTATFFGHMIYNLTEIGGILVFFKATSMSFFPYILVALPLAIGHLEPRTKEPIISLTAS